MPGGTWACKRGPTTVATPISATGNIVYPIGGILWWALIFAAAVSHRLDRSTTRRAGLPIYLAALFSIGAIIATIIAAPIMQSVGSLGNDPGALQSAFDRFTVWGIYIRGVFFALSFLCTVWALIITSRNASSASPGAINQGPSSAVPS